MCQGNEERQQQVQRHADWADTDLHSGHREGVAVSETNEKHVGRSCSTCSLLGTTTPPSQQSQAVCSQVWATLRPLLHIYKGTPIQQSQPVSKQCDTPPGRGSPEEVAKMRYPAALLTIMAWLPREVTKCNAESGGRITSGRRRALRERARAWCACCGFAVQTGIAGDEAFAFPFLHCSDHVFSSAPYGTEQLLTLPMILVAS